MKKDDFKTAVIFRKFKNGRKEIIALFPYVYSFIPGCNDCLTYLHTGQHSDASYSQCMNITIPAKEEEYKDLFEELESIGYNLQVIKRRIMK